MIKTEPIFCSIAKFSDVLINIGVWKLGKKKELPF